MTCNRFVTLLLCYIHLLCISEVFSGVTVDTVKFTPLHSTKFLICWFSLQKLTNTIHFVTLSSGKVLKMEKKLIPTSVVQSLFRPFFVLLPVRLALDCSLDLLFNLYEVELISEDQFYYLRHLAVAYFDILTEEDI